MTAKAPDGKSAAIVGYWQAPYENYAADLVLYSPGRKVALRTNLISGGRDAIGDIEVEFLSLKIEGDTVHLESKGEHYNGSNEFKFPN